MPTALVTAPRRIVSSSRLFWPGAGTISSSCSPITTVLVRSPQAREEFSVESSPAKDRTRLAPEDSRGNFPPATVVISRQNAGSESTGRLETPLQKKLETLHVKSGADPLTKLFLPESQRRRADPTWLRPPRFSGAHAVYTPPRLFLSFSEAPRTKRRARA